MIRCEIESSYGAITKDKVKDPAFVESWNAALAPMLWADDLRITPDDVEKAEGEGHFSKSWWNVKASLSYEDMMTLGRLGISIKPTADETSMLVKIEEKLRSLNLRMGEVERSEALAHGAAAAIHVPDQSLMRIDEVTWLDNACTEELQRQLDDGWRILAVCPPCSQRRPDYILGRRKGGVS